MKVLLKEYRKSKNISQEELAKLVGVVRETIIRIEKGGEIPSLKLAMKIARVFDVPVEEIFKNE